MLLLELQVHSGWTINVVFSDFLSILQGHYMARSTEDQKHFHGKITFGHLLSLVRSSHKWSIFTPWTYNLKLINTCLLNCMQSSLISDCQLLSLIYLKAFPVYVVKVFNDHVYPNRILIWSVFRSTYKKWHLSVINHFCRSSAIISSLPIQKCRWPPHRYQWTQQIMESESKRFVKAVVANSQLRIQGTWEANALK